MRTGLLLRGDAHPCASGGLRREASCPVPQGRSRRGLPGVAMEWREKKRRKKKKKAGGCRQFESLLDVFLSRDIPSSTGMMIFKYCARRKIL